jgi:iron complex transport system substrate-binding protein
VLNLQDGRNASVTIRLPLERIVSLNSGLTELLVAIGLGDKIVGRDETSVTPGSVLSIPVVGANAYEPNVEKIIELNPGVIFSDSMLCYNEGAYDQLAKAGIPIYITDPITAQPATPDDLKPETPTNVDATCDLLQKLSVIVDDKKIIDDYVEFVQYYNNLVRDRLATLSRDQKPRVMLEWYKPYMTFQTVNIYQAGGINIAENLSVYAPTLSPEFVVKENPQIIIRLISSQTHDEQEFANLRNQILDREELADVAAVKNNKVFICDYTFRGGIHSIMGYIYWAKWCQPDLFADLDPVAINHELEQIFCVATLPEGTFVFS